MMTIDDIRESLEDRNLSEVARKTGLSNNTLYKFMDRNSRPFHDTVVKLAAYVRETGLKGGDDANA